jgi:hypothetical protein
MLHILLDSTGAASNLGRFTDGRLLELVMAVIGAFPEVVRLQSYVS